MTIQEYGEIYITASDICIEHGRYKMMEYIRKLLNKGVLTEADAKEIINNIDEN